MGQLIAKDRDNAAYHWTVSPRQSKNWPLCSGPRDSITRIKFAAASLAGTVGWRPAYFAVKSVATVPGCSAIQHDMGRMRPSSIALVWMIWFNAALAVR